MKKILTVLVVLMGFHEAAAQHGRIALVIGMSNYPAGRLPLGKNDSDSIASALEILGFKVIKKDNLNFRDFRAEIDNWGKALTNYEVALFYYSGHGAEVNGRNFLFPVDANPAAESDAEFETIDLAKVLGKIEVASGIPNSKLKSSIILLDACRDNPFTKSWSKSLNSEGGLAMVNTPSGAFIGFAATPGKKAIATGINNSPYTQAILTYIRTPNRTIDGVFNDVNSKTRYLTNGKQIPFKNSSMDGDFYFNLTNNAETKSFNETNFDNLAFDNIRTLLNVANFDASINDLIIAEHGVEFSNSVDYMSLPIMDQCPEKELRYYWRKLSESRFGNRIYDILVQNDLAKFVTDQSYIIYSFNNNKLYNIIVRLYSNDIIFHQRLGQSISVNLDKYPSQFYNSNGNEFTIYSLSQSINETTLAFGKNGTEAYCRTDWWSSK